MEPRILVAGVDKSVRADVEAIVKRALGARAASEPWTVSLVNIAGRWSVTLDGPGERFRGLSFTAEDRRLGEAIRAAIEPGGSPGHAPAAQARSAPTPASPRAPAGTSPPAAVSRAAGEQHDRHVCEHCGQTLVVIYEWRPDDSQARVSVACPHCWKINHVEVGAWAAGGRDYRAEKA